jgi:hypothetical protein
MGDLGDRGEPAELFGERGGVVEAANKAWAEEGESGVELPGLKEELEDGPTSGRPAFASSNKDNTCSNKGGSLQDKVFGALSAY